MPNPRELKDLRYFPHLVTRNDQPTDDGDYEVALFEKTSFRGVHAGNVRFLESALSGVDFGDCNLRGSRFTEVWIGGGCQLNGSDLARTSWLDSEMVTSVVAGTALFDSDLRRVNFFGCKLVGTNFRNAALREVAFVDCTLRDVDFAEARLIDVTFPGSSVSSLHVHKARFRNVDFREASALEIGSGIESLRGAKINYSQLLDLAPAFAQALGILVDD